MEVKIVGFLVERRDGRVFVFEELGVGLCSYILKVVSRVLRLWCFRIIRGFRFVGVV